MIPPTKTFIKSNKCSDSYKVLYHLMTKTNFEVFPMDENFGFTLIKMPASQIILSADEVSLSYSDFMVFIKNQKLYNKKEIIKILGKNNV
jgi:hypothetical protein